MDDRRNGTNPSSKTFDRDLVLPPFVLPLRRDPGTSTTEASEAKKETVSTHPSARPTP